MNTHLKGLFRLASSEDFFALQRKLVPENPSLNLDILRRAMEIAVDAHEVVTLLGLIFKYVKRKSVIVGGFSLDSLINETTESIIIDKLNLLEPDKRLMQGLFVVGELKNQGRVLEANRLLNQLIPDEKLDLTIPLILIESLIGLNEESIKLLLKNVKVSDHFITRFIERLMKTRANLDICLALTTNLDEDQKKSLQLKLMGLISEDKGYQKRCAVILDGFLEVNPLSPTSFLSTAIVNGREVLNCNLKELEWWIQCRKVRHNLLDRNTELLDDIVKLYSNLEDNLDMNSIQNLKSLFALYTVYLSSSNIDNENNVPMIKDSVKIAKRLSLPDMIEMLLTVAELSHDVYDKNRIFKLLTYEMKTFCNEYMDKYLSVNLDIIFYLIRMAKIERAVNSTVEITSDLFESFRSKLEPRWCLLLGAPLFLLEVYEDTKAYKEAIEPLILDLNFKDCLLYSDLGLTYFGDLELASSLLIKGLKFPSTEYVFTAYDAIEIFIQSHNHIDSIEFKEDFIRRILLSIDSTSVPNISVADHLQDIYDIVCSKGTKEFIMGLSNKWGVLILDEDFYFYDHDAVNQKKVIEVLPSDLINTISNSDFRDLKGLFVTLINTFPKDHELIFNKLADSIP